MFLWLVVGVGSRVTHPAGLQDSLLGLVVRVGSTAGHTAILQDSLLGLVVGVGSTVTHPPRRTKGSFEKGCSKTPTIIVKQVTRCFMPSQLVWFQSVWLYQDEHHARYRFYSETNTEQLTVRVVTR